MKKCFIIFNLFFFVNLIYSQDFLQWGNHSICLGDTAILGAKIKNDTFFLDNSLTFSAVYDTLLIPDNTDGNNGNGISNPLTVSLNVSGYVSPNNVITSVDDIEKVCISIEHSYVGDLDIKLISPNATSEFLVDMTPPLVFNYDYGVNNFDITLSGIPYTYCWSMNATNPTIMNSAFSGVIIPSDTYLPDGNYNSFIGDSKNGNWSLEFMDDFNSDNGFVFESSIEFASTSDSVLNVYDTIGTWTSNATILNSNGNEITISPTSPGVYYYEYSILDMFGDTLSFLDSLMVYNPPSDSFIFDTICTGTGYNFFSQTLYSTGVYTHNIVNDYGCNTLMILDLFVTPSSYEVYDTICSGDSINNVPIPNEGTYSFTHTSSNGCDSISNIHVKFRSSFYVFKDYDLCIGDTFFVDGGYIYDWGTIAETTTSSYGCDSTTIFDISMVYNNTFETITICNNESYLFNNQTITTPGAYYSTNTSVSGCDSIHKLEIFVNDTSTFDLSFELCTFNPTYPLSDGTFVNSPGSYTSTSISNNGCPETLHYTITACEDFVGIENVNSNNGFEYFPNPIKNILTVKLLSQKEDSKELVFLNVIGEKIYETKINSNKELIINTSSFSSGVYYLYVGFKSNQSMKKVLIVK